MKKKILNGITWGHTRGIIPLLAAAQRYNELFPQMEINWNKRSLQEFADFPIEKLTESYDLLIIDHPWVGCANATNCVLALNEYLPEDYLKDQQMNSVGFGHLSYQYGGKQWALSIDAAAPVASYRKDLFDSNFQTVPDTWEELMVLAKEGKVLLPGIAIDTLMAFYSFCLAHGKQPFLEAGQQQVIEETIGLKALATMKSLWDLCDPIIFECNPIVVAELMTQTNDYWYCPFAYGYSNYSRNGYAPHILTYADTIRFGSFGRLKTTLGGTGLAVSASAKNQQAAIDFAQWVVAADIQAGLYTANGGQPGHRGAWLNEINNLMTNNYFTHTLPALDNAFVRPRYNGYLHFQDVAGDPIRTYLQHGGNPQEVLTAINGMYIKSLPNAN